jgi:hypothetical protein
VNIQGLFKTKFTALMAIPGIDTTTVLTSMGVTGVVTTAYFTGRASFKAAKTINDEETQLRMDTLKIDPTIINEDDLPTLSFTDKVKLVWPLYVAPISMGTSTITAIVMANHEASKKIAALTVASGISERALKDYKEKIVDKFGDNKAISIRDEIAQDRVENAPPSNTEVIIAGAGDVLCFDITTGRYFQSSVEKIRQAMNRVNYDIINHNYASLSSFYDEIGLDPTPYSDNVGWNTNDPPSMSFSTVMSKDQRPCVAIDFTSPPIAEYDKLW